MQISTSSLLTAQLARTPTPVQSRAPQKAEGFEPLLFAAKAPVQGVAPEAVAAQPKPAAVSMPFARPGSQIDIKI